MMKSLFRSIPFLKSSTEQQDPWGLVPRFSADEIVRAGYQALLSRAAEPGGLAKYIQDIRRRPKRLDRFLRNLLESNESLHCNSPQFVKALLGQPCKTVALGTHCFTSAFLKRQGTKEWSGPFDWIFSTIPMIEHCIKDDFRLFLDQSLYRPVPLDERARDPQHGRVDHAYYLAEYGVKCIFNHHDVHLPENFAYLTRCVDRFRASMRSKASQLYVLTCRHDPGALEDLARLSRTVQSVGCEHRIAAFMIDKERPGRVISEVELLHHDGYLSVYRFVPVSAWSPIRFEDPLDELLLARLMNSVAQENDGRVP